MENLIMQFMTALATALVAMLLTLIPLIGAKVISFIKAKIIALQVKTGAEEYNNDLRLARNIWGIVDEYFRITPTVTATVEAKINMFEAEILKKIPYLTKDEIDHLRQAVAGIVNQAKEVIIAPAIITSGYAQILPMPTVEPIITTTTNNIPVAPAIEPAIVENTEAPIVNN